MPLPAFRRPPVFRITVAVQFAPLPRFGMPEIISVARAFDGWQIVEAPDALPPIVEPEPGEPMTHRINLGLGAPPQRVILASANKRWTAQLQQDRIALQETKLAHRPSYRFVRPQLTRVAGRASTALGTKLLSAEHPPELVEVIYENRIPTGQGWKDFSQLNRVLRAVTAKPAAAPYEKVEQMSLGYSVVLQRDGEFDGRLRFLATPGREDDTDVLQLQVISRRFVRKRPLTRILDESHADVVNGFTSATTEHMHKVWGRTK